MDNLDCSTEVVDTAPADNLRLRGTANSTTNLQTQRASANSQPPGVLRQRSSRLSKYGVSFKPPEDDAVHYASDVKDLSFFEKVPGCFVINTLCCYTHKDSGYAQK